MVRKFSLEEPLILLLKGQLWEELFCVSLMAFRQFFELFSSLGISLLTQYFLLGFSIIFHSK